uniref:Uncharacterized protein n=1 Tax=Anguilla anguilla TaxID=7936 RepID=A0A0E9RDQ7_ANGAN
MIPSRSSPANRKKNTNLQLLTRTFYCVKF